MMKPTLCPFCGACFECGDEHEWCSCPSCRNMVHTTDNPSHQLPTYGLSQDGSRLSSGQNHHQRKPQFTGYLQGSRQRGRYQPPGNYHTMEGKLSPVERKKKSILIASAAAALFLAVLALSIYVWGMLFPNQELILPQAEHPAEATNTFVRGEVSYEVPSQWEYEEIESGTVHYGPDGGLFWVFYHEAELGSLEPLLLPLYSVIARLQFRGYEEIHRESGSFQGCYACVLNFYYYEPDQREGYIFSISGDTYVHNFLFLVDGTVDGNFKEYANQVINSVQVLP